MNLHIQNSDSIEEIIGGYILRIPSFRPKMKLKQSHSVENEKRVFNIRFIAKYQKIEVGPFEGIETFSKKITAPKKIEKGDLARLCRYSSFNSFCEKCPLRIHSVI